MDTQVGYYRVLSCVAALFQIWKHMNAINHGETRLNEHGVICTIICLVKELNVIYNPKTPNTCDGVLETMGVDIKLIRSAPGRCCSWVKPKSGLKLNFDGSFKDNKVGFGGVIRDDKGEVIVAFASAKLGVSAIQAEFEALFIGLHIVDSNNLCLDEVEGDSAQVALVLNQKQSYIWEFADIIEKCLKLLNEKKVMHVFREANRAADSPSKKAELGEKIMFSNGGCFEDFRVGCLNCIPDSTKCILSRECVGIAFS